VQESGFFARDEPILGLGPSPEAANQGVRDEAERGRRPLRASRGFVSRRSSRSRILRAEDRRSEGPRARRGVKQKARDLSKQKAAEIAAKLKSAPRLREGAKAGRRRGQDDRPHRAGLTDPGLSASRPRSTTVAFKLAGRRGQRSDRHRQRHRRDQGAEKSEVTPDEWTRRRIASAKSCWPIAATASSPPTWSKAKQKMKIEVNRESAAARGCS
jgi:hypothetical protein